MWKLNSSSIPIRLQHQVIQWPQITTMQGSISVLFSRKLVITFENTELKNSVSESSFAVEFPCLIDNSPYIIILSGTTSDIEKNQKFEGRESPLKMGVIPSTGLNKEGKIVTGLIRSDVHPDMNLTLKNASGAIVDNTPPEFWTQLRNKIPVTHPLSLIPQT